MKKSIEKMEEYFLGLALLNEQMQLLIKDGIVIAEQLDQLNYKDYALTEQTRLLMLQEKLDAMQRVRTKFYQEITALEDKDGE